MAVTQGRGRVGSGRGRGVSQTARVQRVHYRPGSPSGALAAPMTRALQQTPSRRRAARARSGRAFREPAL